ncbi:MAG TPA: FAD:protein FMN transferase [Sedimentisphaerales bacterium]|nr:FAD:protein FMN transferase [Sedimentisphaerales bacterium]
MDKQNTRIAIGIIVAAFLILALLLRPKGHIESDSGYRQVMGTFARIVAVAPDSGTAKNCIEAAFAELRQVDEMMSDYKSDSEISRVNRDAYKGPVKVSGPTFEVAQKAIYFSELSDGAFDITVGPLVDLWRLAAEANAVPTEAQLQQARAKVGYEKLLLDANALTVRFAVEGMRLDMGGIAKGYAIDKAIEAMQKGGALGGMVDVGGDIRCFGVPTRGKTHWLIGLQDPNRPEDWIDTSKPSLVLKLNDAAIATSGDYRRFVLIDGQKYSHILDTKTGRGGKGFSSVTIIAKKAVDADALATAVSVMGAEKGLALIQKLPDTEAILISPRPEFKLVKTPGAENYLK